MKISNGRGRPRPNQESRRGLLSRLWERLPGPVPPLAPAYAPAGFPHPPQPTQPDPMNRVFGRRKDEASPPQDEGGDEVGESDPQGSPESAAAPEPSAADELPPIPSAPAADEEGAPDESAAAGGTSPVESSWTSPYAAEPSTEEPSPFAYDAEAERQDLPAWTPSPLSEAAFPSFAPEPSSDEPTPWSAEEETPTAYGSGDYAPEPASAWPSSEQESQLWSTPAEPAEAVPEVGEEAAGAEVEAVEPAVEEVEVVQEVPVEMAGEAPAEPTGWGEVAVAEPTYPHYEPEPEVTVYQGSVALVEDARTFPLPEGEVVFRNLRAGFTDPARLLRHLAGEGHTGVLHVAAVDGRNTYVVLVDGYVVAVANDNQGRLTTTTRVAFPNFPNSQDVLNVITYPREIARGLGLLLHAPVHFRGLGAMFVNLDGLRSYLSKHSASGGMVVASDTGTGVALFDDGRLVGAYADNRIPEADLTPLRELIKDLDAEIDVRLGGPRDLDPIPLDTLLAGYSL